MSVHRLHRLNSAVHQVVLTFTASAEWVDTGLQPDVLAGRPILCGFAHRMLWVLKDSPEDEPQPILLLRHVVDDQFASGRPARKWKGPESLEPVPVAPGSVCRFPARGGRLEVCLGRISATNDVLSYQGFLQLDLYINSSGDDDAVLREVDHIQVYQCPVEEFPPLDRLPDPRGAPSVNLADNILH